MRPLDFINSLFQVLIKRRIPTEYITYTINVHTDKTLVFVSVFNDDFEEVSMTVHRLNNERTIWNCIWVKVWNGRNERVVRQATDDVVRWMEKTTCV